MKYIKFIVVLLASLLLSCAQETVTPQEIVNIEGVSFNAETDTSTLTFSAENDYILASQVDQTLAINHGVFTNNHFEIRMPLNPSEGIKSISDSNGNYSILWKTENGDIYTSEDGSGNVHITKLKLQNPLSKDDGKINFVLELQANFNAVLTNTSDNSTVTISNGIINY